VIGNLEWFVSDAKLDHSGHLPTAIDPRQMGKEEERALANNFASLKTCASPRTPSRKSSERSDASTSTTPLFENSPRSSPSGRQDDLQHLTPTSTISQLLDTLNLNIDDYEERFFEAGAEVVEDLIWLAESLSPPLKKIHALRIVTACKVLDEVHGRKVRVKVEPID